MRPASPLATARSTGAPIRAQRRTPADSLARRPRSGREADRDARYRASDQHDERQQIGQGRPKLREGLRATVLTCGNILFIVYAAFIFSYAISMAGVGEALTTWIVRLELTRLEFFLALVLLYTVLGCLIESLGMLVIAVPLVYPILLRHGIDPVWFGVMLVLFIEMGQISPPLGINLFFIQGIWDGKLADVVLRTIPFHLNMFVLVPMLAIWPDIALWLPQHMTARP